MVSGAEFVVRTLKKAGVDTIFGLHGAHLEEIFQSCANHGITIVDTRHEAAAGHAAEGYARGGRRLGVALVTAGGGFTNVVTSLANAYLDRTPVLYLAASGSLRDTEVNTLQAGIDQVAVARPISKWAHQVTVPANLPRFIAQGIRTALSGPKGPVLLDLPWDVLTAKVNEAEMLIPGALGPGFAPAPSAAALAQTLALLTRAERPLILVGSEAVGTESAALLRVFAERAGMPVYSDFEGHGLLPHDHPNAAGLIQGLYNLRAPGIRPDVVLMLGLRFGLYTGLGSDALIPLDAKVIHVDLDGRELGRLRDPALAIRADSGEMLRSLVEASEGHAFPDRAAWVRAVRQTTLDRRRKLLEIAHRRKPLHPFRAVAAIVEAAGDRADFVADGAESYHWFTEVVPGYRPSCFLTHGYHGSMGIGIGLAMGAQTLNRDRPVVLVTGDGAFGFSIAEFDTMVRHQLPVVVVILNNRNWGAVRHYQEVFSGPDRVTGTQLDNGDYHDTAASLGAFGRYVEDEKDIVPAIRAAIASGKPACINIRVDINAIPPEAKIMLGRDPLSPD